MEIPVEPQFEGDADLNQIRKLIVDGFNQVLRTMDTNTKDVQKNINLLRGDLNRLDEKVKALTDKLNGDAV
ncbi:hypothetical protein [Larkinella humicola]|uniref:Uncharacterized protein n=1 Tax=Larkinella humicola TaxID=2607654 RepID=A0A5N1J0W3_9BACT|nr:hypothetical protein [Larkinella humicola]KAA9340345.1 hypothetical protein F0P93_31325 [Larkinella humicola]